MWSRHSSAQSGQGFAAEDIDCLASLVRRGVTDEQICQVLNHLRLPSTRSSAVSSCPSLASSASGASGNCVSDARMSTRSSATFGNLASSFSSLCADPMPTIWSSQTERTESPKPMEACQVSFQDTLRKTRSGFDVSSVPHSTPVNQPKVKLNASTASLSARVIASPAVPNNTDNAVVRLGYASGPNTPAAGSRSEQIYFCPACPSTFVSSGGLRRHFFEECERQQEFRCPDCKKVCKSASKFKSHHKTCINCVNCEHAPAARKELLPRKIAWASGQMINLAPGVLFRDLESYYKHVECYCDAARARGQSLEVMKSNWKRSVVIYNHLTQQPYLSGPWHAKIHKHHGTARPFLTWEEHDTKSLLRALEFGVNPQDPREVEQLVARAYHLSSKRPPQTFIAAPSETDVAMSDCESLQPSHIAGDEARRGQETTAASQRSIGSLNIFPNTNIQTAPFDSAFPMDGVDVFFPETVRHDEYGYVYESGSLPQDVNSSSLRDVSMLFNGAAMTATLVDELEPEDAVDAPSSRWPRIRSPGQWDSNRQHHLGRPKLKTKMSGLFKKGREQSNVDVD